MVSKEAALKGKIGLIPFITMEAAHVDCFYQAMDEYVKEVGIDFVGWLIDNTEIIKEEKITLYRYHDTTDGWGNYVLDDIFLVYTEELNKS